MKTRTKVVACALVPAVVLAVTIVHNQGYSVSLVEVLLLTGVVGLTAGAVAGFFARDIEDSKRKDSER